MTTPPNSKVQGPYSHISIRLIALALFIFLLNAWVSTNLDEHLVMALIANGVLAMATVVGSLMNFLGKQHVETTSSDLQEILLTLLRTPILIGLYFTFLVVGSLLGSVSVSSDGLVINAAVRVAPVSNSIDSARPKPLDGQNSLVRFLRWTTPFGRPYSVEVEGFVPTTFDLYPWVGKRIRLASDMTQARSLLIRFPSADIELVNESRLTIAVDGVVLGTSTMDTEHMAVLVGQQRPAFSDFYDEWQFEFKAYNVPESRASRCVLGWTNPVVMKLSRPLVPGLVVEATVYSRTDSVLYKQSFLIGPDKVQDVVFR